MLRIFELLEEKADRKKIRELLLRAGKETGSLAARRDSAKSWQICYSSPYVAFRPRCGM